MFEVGWLEMLVIGVVLIVVVGPKDLPGMLRTFGRFTTQMRRMAGDFRRQLDDAMREAELDDVRKAAGDLKKLDPRDNIRKAMNPMKAVGDEIRSSLKTATQAPEPHVPTADQKATPMESPEPASPPADVAAPDASAGAANPEPVQAGPVAMPAADAEPAGKRNAGEVA